MPLFHPRRHEVKAKLEGFAALHGLQYSEADAFGLRSLPFPLFSEGDDQGCQDVVYGTWNGNNAWAFVTWTMERDSDHDESYCWYTCAAAPLPAECPSVDIHAAGALTRAMRSIGLRGRQVPFESGEFNKRWRVTSAEPAFASAVITPDMIEWLLKEGADWHFEVNSHYILVYRRRDRHDVDETADVLDMVTGFYGHIPDVVASLYRLNLQPQPTPQDVYEMARARAVGFNPVWPGQPVPGVPGGVQVTAVTTAGAMEAADPRIAAAFQQLQAMGIPVGPATPVQVASMGTAGAAGAPGHLTITGIRELGAQAGGARMVQLDGDITSQGGQPYHVSQTALVLPDHADRVVPGATLAVRIDPANPSLFSVDWNAS